MSEYTLEIKQIVDYPRCRIYRQFVQALIADRSIRVSGGSGLFYFVVLCAYANFRTSYKRIDGISLSKSHLLRIGNIALSYSESESSNSNFFILYSPLLQISRNHLISTILNFNFRHRAFFANNF